MKSSTHDFLEKKKAILIRRDITVLHATCTLS